MYKAVTERKLIADDYFTAQFKVRHILKAAINSDKEKFREIFTTCSKTLKTNNNDDPEISKIRVIVQHEHWPYGGSDFSWHYFQIVDSGCCNK